MQIFGMSALAVGVTVGLAYAWDANVNPRVRLVDTLDELHGVGFCIDMFGTGTRSVNCQTVIAHSCNDYPIMEYNPDDGTITSPWYDGNCACGGGGCLTVSGTSFSLQACDGSAAQKFTFDANPGEIKNNGLCMVVSSSTHTQTVGPAGAHSHRDMSMADCSSVDAARKTWEYANGGSAASGCVDGGGSDGSGLVSEASSRMSNFMTCWLLAVFSLALATKQRW